MRTYLNIGPGRSGTSSFYNMCAKIEKFNIGKIKEPLNDNIELNGVGGYSFDTKNYIDNWGEVSEDSILLDASGQIIFAVNKESFRSYMLRYVDRLCFICLVRDPEKYYISKIYNNYLVEILEKKNIHQKYLDFLLYRERIKLNIAEMVDDIDRIFSDEEYLRHYSYSNIIIQAQKIFKDDEIIIIPIELFDNHKKRLSDFLEVDFTNMAFPHENKTRKAETEKLNILRDIISYRSKMSDLLHKIIEEDLKNIKGYYFE